MIYESGKTHSTFSSLLPASEKKKNLQCQNLKNTLKGVLNNTVLILSNKLIKRYEPRAVHIESDACKQAKSYSWHWSNYTWHERSRRANCSDKQRKHPVKCRENEKSKFLMETNSEYEILRTVKLGGNKLTSVGVIK